MVHTFRLQEKIKFISEVYISDKDYMRWSPKAKPEKLEELTEKDFNRFKEKLLKPGIIGRAKRMFNFNNRILSF